MTPEESIKCKAITLEELADDFESQIVPDVWERKDRVINNFLAISVLYIRGKAELLRKGKT